LVKQYNTQKEEEFINRMRGEDDDDEDDLKQYEK